ncbi:MAG: PIG-L family deacetylase [Treponema sp.]|nr:PIG-L family deacetylase [Treponema sp.]
MIKSALILAPHQDDELNIAGLLLDQMKAAGMNITVCFATNGDYNGNETTRLSEAKSVAGVFGGWDIVYLGYGDTGYEGALLNAEDDDMVATSPAGFSETHGVGDIQDFHFVQHGEHISYTRNNLLSDIKEVILSVRADLVFCVDADNHPDHVLLSVLFDRAMSEITQTTDYHPLVLKKFAYLGTWYGVEDYFMGPAKSTECLSCGGEYESRKDCKPYVWNNRIRFAVNPSVYSLRFWKSTLFKAYKCYKSQNGIAFFPRAVNADSVYWFYDTRNGDYKQSIEFPIEETPFTLYQEPNSVRSKQCHFFKLLYRVYLFFLWRIPNKIKRMVGHGI